MEATIEDEAENAQKFYAGCFPLNLVSRRKERRALKLGERELEEKLKEEEEEEEEEVSTPPNNKSADPHKRKSARLSSKEKIEIDVVRSARLSGIMPLLKEKPLSKAQPYRCGKSCLDLHNFSITMNEHSIVGKPLYKAFVQSMKKSNDKSYTMLFHGTGCEATEDILINGMNPKLRVSSSGDWFTKDINYALTRAICRVSSRESALSSNKSGVLSGMLSYSSASPFSLTHRSTHENFKIPPATSEPPVHVIAFVVIDEATMKIGEHTVCESHTHSLPLFKISFPRYLTPAEKR